MVWKLQSHCRTGQNLFNKNARNCKKYQETNLQIPAWNQSEFTGDATRSTYFTVFLFAKVWIAQHRPGVLLLRDFETWLWQIWQRTATSLKSFWHVTTLLTISQHISSHLTFSNFHLQRSIYVLSSFDSSSLHLLWFPCLKGWTVTSYVFVFNVTKAYINCSICAGPMTFALPAVAGLKSRLVGEEEQGRASAVHRCASWQVIKIYRMISYVGVSVELWLFML